MTSRLFVYGTLRSDALHPMHRVLGENASFVGRATVGGVLYDLGSYPGAVPAPDSTGRVSGELYELNRFEVLHSLDAYEGCGEGGPEPSVFRRALVDARLDDGGELRSWIYWYAGEVGRAEPVASGDYSLRDR